MPGEDLKLGLALVEVGFAGCSAGGTGVTVIPGPAEVSVMRVKGGRAPWVTDAVGRGDQHG